MAKFIFVTGGVVSSLGKGITAASLGMLLKAWGLKTRLQKFDPYLNVDPGTMNPYQHGEVYVTDDGAETDLDLGHYERFTGEPTSRDSNYTAGRVYFSVISRERRGDYLGQTIQLVPHVTDEIKACVRKLDRPGVNVVVSEIGGTVGDIEGLPFMEAIRQIGLEEGRGNVLYIHVTLVPYIRAAGEIKTKPTQHSVGRLREIGILPDVLICRTEKPLNEQIKAKISLFCNVDRRAVIEEPPRRWPGSAESSCPAASARAAFRARSKRFASPARTVCRSSASASACSARRSSSPETSVAWRALTAPRAIPMLRILSYASWKSRRRCGTRAAPCAWGRGHASSSRARARTRPTGSIGSASDTAIATSSTTGIANGSRRRAWSSAA